MWVVNSAFQSRFCSLNRTSPASLGSCAADRNGQAASHGSRQVAHRCGARLRFCKSESLYSRLLRPCRSESGLVATSAGLKITATRATLGMSALAVLTVSLRAGSPAATGSTLVSHASLASLARPCYSSKRVKASAFTRGLLADPQHHTGADGLATLTDGKALTHLHGDRVV